jgi:hypothetical protein
VIRNHTLEATEGQTYADMPRSVMGIALLLICIGFLVLTVRVLRPHGQPAAG